MGPIEFVSIIDTPPTMPTTLTHKSRKSVQSPIVSFGAFFFRLELLGRGEEECNE